MNIGQEAYERKQLMSIYNTNTYEEAEYKRRKVVLFDSIKISVVVYAIIFVCGILADGFGLPIQAALGATAEQIKASQNMTLFVDNLPLLIIGFPSLILLCVGMLEYLQHGK